MSDHAAHSSPRWTTPVQFLQGVGPDRAARLERLDVRTIGDLVELAPRDYQDLQDVQSVAELEDGEFVRLHGTVVECDERLTGAGRTMLGVLVRATGGNVRALWFNQPWMRGKFSSGQQVLLAGRAQFRGGIWQLVHPQTQWIDEPVESAAPSLVPIYPLTEGLSQAELRKMARAAVDEAASEAHEIFTPEQLSARSLSTRREALRGIHLPTARAELVAARRRLAYEELFLLQLGLAVRRQQRRQSETAAQLVATPKIDARIRNLFSFPFTPGQEAAIADVRADLARSQPMNRLLQGDVGSGKTIVALYAVLTTVACRQQAAILAPTEILARQHADTLGRVLSSSRVRWACLTGGTPAPERRETLGQLADGALDVVIGTHALLRQDVRFARLALLVIDEQHKFGVRQRAALRQVELTPHELVMTATPIPRTIAMTLYGDLDVSTISDAPAGRQTVHTYLVSPEKTEAWWDFVRRKLREGRQLYVVAPHVDAKGDDDEADDAADLFNDETPPASLDEMYERLANGSLAEFRVELLHGRMTARQKDAVMEAFRSGKTQALVCTTVIEVGIDVANATLLAIEGAQCFGLAQLHQLRGRIARGSHPGFCGVFAAPKSDRAQARLEAFVNTPDGFKLAELDFSLRGPGELLGTRQHGLPPLRFADLQRDSELLAETRQDAVHMAADDSGLAQPEHAAIRRELLDRYGAVLDLGVVG